MTTITTTLIVKEPGEAYSIVQEQKPIVTLVNIGTQGPKGESGSSSYYKFNQSTPASVWTIEHKLSRNPSVTVQDSAEENVEGSCEYVNENKLILTFSAAFSGVAYLN